MKYIELGKKFPRREQRCIYFLPRLWKKAFDTVQHDKFIEILQSVNIDSKEICLVLKSILNEYFKKHFLRAGIKLNGEVINYIKYADTDDTILLAYSIEGKF